MPLSPIRLTACCLTLLHASCADIGAFKRESPEDATEDDRREAQYLRELLESDPLNHGSYEITPGPTVTTVRFSRPERPGDEDELRQSLKDIRADMVRDLGHIPNTLRFVFPKTTVEE